MSPLLTVCSIHYCMPVVAADFADYVCVSQQYLGKTLNLVDSTNVFQPNLAHVSCNI